MIQINNNIFYSFDKEIYDTVISQPKSYDLLLNYTDMQNQSDSINEIADCLKGR